MSEPYSTISVFTWTSNHVLFFTYYSPFTHYSFTHCLLIHSLLARSRLIHSPNPSF